MDYVVEFFNLAEPSITIGDLLGAVVTLVLGLYVGASFQVNSNKQQRIKELLLERLQEIIVTMQELDGLAEARSYNLNRATALAKKYVVSVINLQNLFNRIGKQYVRLDVERNLEENAKRLKKLLSYTPVSGESEITITNSQVEISESRCAEIKTLIDTICTHLLEVKYQVIIR